MPASTRRRNWCCSALLSKDLDANHHDGKIAIVRRALELLFNGRALHSGTLTSSSGLKSTSPGYSAFIGYDRVNNFRQ